MTDSDKYEAYVTNVLISHFPEVDKAEIFQAAEAIMYTLDIGSAMAEVSSLNKSSDADLKNLRDARKDLGKAAKRIRDMGIWGRRRLQDAAAAIDSFDGDAFHLCSRPPNEAAEIIADHIDELLSKLPEPDAWKAEIDRGVGVVGAQGRPENTLAKYLATTLYSIFAKLSGATPTISTDRVQEEKYGPFLELVSSIFELLDLDAKAATTAREVCQEKSREKK